MRNALPEPSRRAAPAVLLLAGALVLALACSQPPPPAAPSPEGGAPAAPASPPVAPPAEGTPVSPEPTATADAGTPAPATPAPAPAPAPTPIPVKAVLAAIGSGPEQPLARDGSAVVDPAVAFRVEVGAHLTDGRLVLLDAQDAMVASSGTTELGPGWTRYHLVPEAPLTPGSSYTLRVEGAAAREAHDEPGSPFTPVAMKLRTSGERPAPAPSSTRHTRRRRH